MVQSHPFITCIDGIGCSRTCFHVPHHVHPFSPSNQVCIAQNIYACFSPFEQLPPMASARFQQAYSYSLEQMTPFKSEVRSTRPLFANYAMHLYCSFNPRSLNFFNYIQGSSSSHHKVSYRYIMSTLQLSSLSFCLFPSARCQYSYAVHGPTLLSDYLGINKSILPI